MKACVATGRKRRIECKEIPTPSIEPGMLLLKTKYACICGSDLEYLDGSLELIGQGVTHPGAVIGHQIAAELGLDKSSDMPSRGIRPGSIPGHEFVAEVVEVGEEVTGWTVGDRAVPGSGIPGQMPTRPIRRQPGSYETFRAMAEYILTPPYTVQKVPAHVCDEEAAFVEPLMTGVGAVEGAELKPGQSAVIIGAGKIGLLAAMAAKVAGGAPVISIDLVQSRLDKALEVGVDATLNANEVDVIDEVAKLTGDGPDAILICVRDGEVLNQAVEMGKRGATIVLAGFVPPMEVNPMLWTVKQLRIVGVLGGPAGGRNVSVLSMYLIAHKQIDPKPLITEVMPFDECQRAIDSVYSGENIAVLLRP